VGVLYCSNDHQGKSTLLSVLFSLGPLSSGRVTIAGYDLSEISCREVRKKIAIVPQFPTLFDGTVRENLVGGNDLDLTGSSAADDEDEFLEATLRTCRLGAVVERGGLDATLGALSDGEAQLFCVARALVTRPRILVLDEATADLDAASATELLRVVEAEFKETTVLSIAHRLNFIRNSDRILVLNTGGTVNAFASPAKLLEDPDGYFSKQLAEENQAM
jgi:ABC-type multidrug transport system fused ATPase/permease subunit